MSIILSVTQADLDNCRCYDPGSHWLQGRKEVEHTHIDWFLGSAGDAMGTLAVYMWNKKLNVIVKLLYLDCHIKKLILVGLIVLDTCTLM